MGNYDCLLYHIVFGTKHRKPTINPAHEIDLYKYIWGIANNKKCKLYQINGIEDHIHICSDIHPALSISDFIKSIKTSSSRWMKEDGKFPDFEGWQDGYGAFSYSLDKKNNVVNYIKKQKTHHKTETFYDEFKRLLIENEVPFNEKYLV